MPMCRIESSDFIFVAEELFWRNVVVVISVVWVNVVNDFVLETKATIIQRSQSLSWILNLCPDSQNDFPFIFLDIRNFKLLYRITWNSFSNESINYNQVIISSQLFMFYIVSCLPCPHTFLSTFSHVHNYFPTHFFHDHIKLFISFSNEQII